MRRGRGRLGIALFTASLGGCQFSSPSTDGTAYRCSGYFECPSGYVCRAGVCQDKASVDAQVDLIDADNQPMPDQRPDAGASGPDALVDAAPDAAPDAMVDAGGDAAMPPAPRTLVFAERASADVHGVTTDTWLDSTNTDSNRGQSTELQIDSEPPQVMLIRFDVRAIPAGSVVESAELGLQTADAAASGDRATARVLRQGWDEREATWNQATTGKRWPSAGAGGDAVGDAAGSFAADVSGDIKVTLTVAAVQAWVDHPGDNFGLRLDIASPSSNDLRIRSREAAGASRPSLKVRFTPPAP